jgi:hypothetical protein
LAIIRRQDGSLDSHRRLGGFRTLLPFEVELCESIGITDKEYFEFLDLVDAKPVEADIVAGPAAGAFALYSGTIGTSTFALTWLGQVVVSVALAAISYLLTPKPKDPGQQPRLTIGGVQGRSRFNPTTGFDSVQDLASLGSFIPLVYARQGVRVSSQLLWSQIRTTQYGQTMNAIVLFSNGEIGAKPQFDSLALGESFLSDLPLSKQKVYFSRGARNDGRLQGVSDDQTPHETDDDQYQKGSALNENNYLGRGEREYDDVDPFKVKVWEETYSGGNANFEYKPSFSSAKTPSTNNKFGLYSPMPNGNAYKINWELILLLRDADDGVKKDLRIKMGKLVHKYPRYVGITNSNYREPAATQYFYNTADNGVVLNPIQTKSAIDSSSGDLFVNYRIYHDTNESAWIDASITDPDPNKKWNKFSPWGSSDAKSVADTIREGVDDSVKIGEQFMVGSTLMTAVHEDNGNIWVGGAEGFKKAIRLKADEPGYLEFRNTDETRLPYESLIVQKVDLATLSNSRQCNITEIGLKSTVWRQITGFPNVNQMPSQARIESYERQNGSIQLGQVSKYIKRISCFKVQAKKINSGDDFVDITPKILAVQGSSPTAQYNAIFIHHDKLSQYEFRFLPVPGNVVLNHFDDRVIHILGYAEHLQSHKNDELDLRIAYHAKEGQLPLSGEIEEGSNITNNPEWIRGGLGIGLPIIDDDGNEITGGGVNNFTPSSQGDDLFAPPTYNFIHTIFDPDNKTTYTGIGPNNATGTWTNVTQRNLKGTPADGGNAYYSPYHGIAATATPINSTHWIWNFHFGGTLIPLGSLGSITLPINQFPTADNQFTKAVEELDSNGIGTGRWHRFRVAVNPTSLGGKEDWRRTVNGSYHFAVCVQRADRSPIPTETTVVRDTTTTRGVGSGLKVAVTTKTDGSNTFKSFALHASGDGYFDGDKATIDNESPTVTLDLIGKEKPSNVPDVDEHSDWSDDGTAGLFTNYWQVTKHNRNTAIADYFLFDAEKSSHEQGSEHEVTYMNEIVHEDVGNVPQINYEKLAIGGIRMGASASVSSFNSFSAFIQEGIKVDRLIPDANPNQNPPVHLNRETNPNNFIATDDFVEIVHDLLTNNVYGAGDLVGHDGVDRRNMIEGARYCRANGFRWNGVIDRTFNLREFIFEHAAYNFLDFSILGGRFSLKPSFPINANYTINYNATIDNKGIEIKALFTDGNMKDIKVTFLTPEERKMFKATVIYRNDKINSKNIAGFPENISKTYAYNPNPSVVLPQTFRPTAEKLPEEVFDLSNWCTHEKHAKLFAAIALVIRKEVDHGIVFQTPPSSVFGLMAGDYIRVLTEATHTSRFNNGSIDADGKVICRATISGEIDVYVWSPGTLGGIEKKRFAVNASGTNTAGLKNKLFAQVDTTEEDRVYKVESITYGEEGLIQIAASHVPLTDDKKLAVLEHSNPDNEPVFESYFPELTI